MYLVRSDRIPVHNIPQFYDEDFQIPLQQAQVEYHHQRIYTYVRMLLPRYGRYEDILVLQITQGRYQEEDEPAPRH